MRRRFVSILLPLLIVCLLHTVTWAGYNDQPPPLAGWTHSPRFPDDTPQGHGIILSGADVVRSSPTIAEIDGNPGNGKEVAVGGSDGRLYVYHANGQLAWQADVLPGPCSPAGGDFKLNSAPAVGTLAGDGKPYVVIGYGTITPSDCDGGVAAYVGSSGNLAWRFSLRQWAAGQGYREAMYGVLSSPALADTDGDGRMEIGFGGFDRNVYLLNYDGSVRWYYHAADTVWSSPAFANIDSDAALELIIGTDIAANAQLNPPISDGGYLYAFDTQPRSPQRIEFRTGFVWQTFFDQAIFSSPAIGDVLSTNPGLEAVIGASCYHPDNSSNKRGRWLKIVRLSDGAVLQTLNAPACVQSSPALGDLDDDGALEIVATVNGATQIGGDGLSRVVAWEANDPTPKWATVPRDANSGVNDPYGGDLQSAVIADLDGNGSLEVLAANHWSVHVLRGRDGVPLTCQKTPDCGAQLALYTAKTVKATPAVGDIDGNGTLEVVIGGGNVYSNNRGMLYAWTGFAGRLGSPPGGQAAYSAPWPMFRANAQHSGVQRMLVVTPAELNLVMRINSSRQYRLRISASDGAPLTWSVVNENDPQGIISVSPTSGTAGTDLVVTINAPGTVALYRAEIELRAPGVGWARVPIQVYAAQQVYNVTLPSILR